MSYVWKTILLTIGIYGVSDTMIFIKFIWKRNPLGDIRCLGYFDPATPRTIYIALHTLYREYGQRNNEHRLINMLIETVMHESVHSWLHINEGEEACDMYDNIILPIEKWFRNPRVRINFSRRGRKCPKKYQ